MLIIILAALIIALILGRTSEPKTHKQIMYAREIRAIMRGETV